MFYGWLKAIAEAFPTDRAFRQTLSHTDSPVVLQRGISCRSFFLSFQVTARGLLSIQAVILRKLTGPNYLWGLYPMSNLS